MTTETTVFNTRVRILEPLPTTEYPVPALAGLPIPVEARPPGGGWGNPLKRAVSNTGLRPNKIPWTKTVGKVD